MFSDHLRKFDEMPYRTLLWVAAGLVILCQLVVVGFVADAQVTKAKVRDYQRNTEMLGIAQCVEETRAGAARHACIQQARIVASSSLAPPAGSATQPQLAHASGETGNALPTQPAQGFMGASLAVR